MNMLNKTLVTTLVTVFLFVLCTANAATVAYWRFEQDLGVTADSGPNGISLGHPFPDGQANEYALPGSGAGSAFPTTIPQTGASNGWAAEGNQTNQSWLLNPYRTANNSALQFSSGQLSVEAFINANPNGIGTRSIVSQGGTSSIDSNNSWALSIRSNNSFLLQLSPDGNWPGTNFATIQLTAADSVELGDDYYIGLTFNASDTSEDGLVFYYQNLTDGGPLNVVKVTHAATATLNVVDTGITIGSTYSGSSHFYGLIDEVRISDTQLSQSELLISIPEPASSAFPLAALGIILLVIIRRYKK